VTQRVRVADRPVDRNGALRVREAGVEIRLPAGLHGHRVQGTRLHGAVAMPLARLQGGLVPSWRTGQVRDLLVRVGQSEHAEDLACGVAAGPVQLQCAFVPFDRLPGAAEAAMDLGEVVQGARLAGDVAELPVQGQRRSRVPQRRPVLLGAPVDETEPAQALGLARPVLCVPMDAQRALRRRQRRRVLPQIRQDTGLAQQYGRKRRGVLQ
jgi:hypothetical protein